MRVSFEWKGSRKEAEVPSGSDVEGFLRAIGINLETALVKRKGEFLALGEEVFEGDLLEVIRVVHGV